MKYAAASVHVKNEEDLIGEWMAFHRSVGFEHLIVIDNGSTDRTADVVKGFPDQDCVDYLFIPMGNPTNFATISLKSFGHRFEWMAFIDADEFLYPTDCGDIRCRLANLQSDIAGLGVFWHIYGSSGHVDKPFGRTIETMTKRANNNYFLNRHVKSIVKPKHVLCPLGSHVFKLDGLFVDEKGRKLHDEKPYGFFEDVLPTHDLFRINHYHVRSRQQYMQKSKRGYFGMHDDKISKSPERFEEMWNAHDMNDVEDNSAVAYVPMMKFFST